MGQMGHGSKSGEPRGVGTLANGTHMQFCFLGGGGPFLVENPSFQRTP